MSRDREAGMLDVALAAAALCLLMVFGAYLLALTASATRTQQALSEALRNVARIVQRTHAPVGAAGANAEAQATFAAMGVSAAGLAASVAMAPGCAGEQVQLRIPLPMLPGMVLTSATIQPLSLTGACA
ncbi:MAG: hypothetical protein M0Z29_07275 [Actinomycetota bacterium]|nr:hypothetical protein [Actinomycetota bacterium]